MDKNLLIALNNLNIQDSEIKELEEAADKKSEEQDKYYVKNSNLIRKIAVKTLEAKALMKLRPDESVEKVMLADQGYFGNNLTVPSGLIADSVVYYFITLTNRRIFLVGLNQYYKELIEYEEEITAIEYVSQAWDSKNLCQIKLQENYIELTSKAEKSQIIELINILKGKGVEEKPYSNKIETRWIIALYISIGIAALSLVMHYL